MKNYILSFCLTFLSSLFCIAQDTYDWENNAPDGNFKQGAAGCRWSKNIGASCFWDEPGYGTVKFNNNTYTSMTNNATNFSTFRVEFLSNGSSSRTISGNAIKFFDYSNTIPAIINNSGTSHALNFAIEIGNNSTGTSPQYGFEINAYSGALNIGGNIYAENNSSSPKTLVLMSNLSGSGAGAINISGIISDGATTLNLLKKDNNTATLTGSNTYSGSTNINGGTLKFNRSGGTTIPTSNNVTIDGGTLQISTNQTLNNLTLTSGNLIIDTNTTLTINGTFTCNGGTITNNGTLVINGSSTFPGTSTTISTMNNLELGYSSGLTLNNGLSVNGTLTLTSGVLTLGNHNLTIGASGNISGTFTSSKMINTNGTGVLVRGISSSTSYLFPIGTTGTYTPTTLDFTSGSYSSATASVIAIASKHAQNNSSTDYLNRNWEISQTGISSFNCNITCVYDQNDVVGTESNLYCGKYSSGVWTAASSTNSSTNELFFANASSFSDITGGELSALPVSLTHFSAIRNANNQTIITWQTATEINNKEFILERSTNNQTYHAIGTIPGANNSASINNYSYVDAFAPNQVLFYKLTQIDFNGKSETFGSIKVHALSIDEITISPNPTHGIVQINLPNDLLGDTVNVDLIDAFGKKIENFEPNASSILTFDISHLKHGLYFLQFSAYGTNKVIKIQKN